jgi:hypothetical protein
VHSNTTGSFVILAEASLPAGLSLTPSSGVILGTPTVEGLFALNFSARLLSTGGLCCISQRLYCILADWMTRIFSSLSGFQAITIMLFVYRISFADSTKVK